MMSFNCLTAAVIYVSIAMQSLGFYPFRQSTIDGQGDRTVLSPERLLHVQTLKQDGEAI